MNISSVSPQTRSMLASTPPNEHASDSVEPGTTIVHAPGSYTWPRGGCVHQRPTVMPDPIQQLLDAVRELARAIERMLTGSYPKPEPKPEPRPKPKDIVDPPPPPPGGVLPPPLPVDLDRDRTSATQPDSWPQGEAGPGISNLRYGSAH